MLLHVHTENKIIGSKQLFIGLTLDIEAEEKVAIIGRNGVGKTTLFRMLIGEDQEYTGEIIFKKGTWVVATQQEHFDLGGQSVITYILVHLPEYAALKQVIDTYPAIMGDDMHKIHTYTEALERFGMFGYYTVEDRVRQSLDTYQLGQMADRPMSTLSGGQKRFVELVRVEHSNANLALIDEPTNHMDYVAKQAFMEWLNTVKHGVVVITHDRDVLQAVSRIIEIKDQQAFSFPGNYDAYLQQNALQTASDLHGYETAQRRIANVKKQILYARSKKASWGGTADKKNPFVVMENRLLKELGYLEEEHQRPTFWIDQESVAGLRPKLEESYHKHKARTIRIHRVMQDERERELLKLENVQVGYGRPLFAPLNLRVLTGNRFRVIGRNGAGKTTLMRTILESLLTARPTTLLRGTITLDTKLRINTYEQEMDGKLLDMTLAAAIEHVYEQFSIHVTPEQIMRTLSDYLFDPYDDRQQLVRNLSGGQKARLQLIKLFANEPNLIILDEPTNHLDLPSIEELEATLKQYKGALLYISHDSYLAEHLGGEQVVITPSIG
jgi:ATP-binding cassette, subfamily F, member 3